jgi:hypothetical protein
MPQGLNIILLNVTEIILTACGLIFLLSLLLLSAQRFAVYIALKHAGFNSLYVTGVVGVPIHEVSHALLALLFRHNIKSISLFSPDKTTGVLGYVEHSHKNTVFQTIGCFFIGVAPLAGGVITLYLLNLTLFPEINTQLNLNSIPTAEYKDNSLASNLAALLILSIEDLKFVYNSFSISNVLWLYLTCSISLHMVPSNQDLKNSITGIVAIFFTVLLCLFLAPELTKYAAQWVQIQSVFISRILMLACYLTIIPIFIIWLGFQIKLSIRIINDK